MSFHTTITLIFTLLSGCTSNLSPQRARHEEPQVGELIAGERIGGEGASGELIAGEEFGGVPGGEEVAGEGTGGEAGINLKGLACASRRFPHFFQIMQIMPQVKHNCQIIVGK